MKRIIRVIVIALCLITVFSLPISAATPYQTHTYMATSKQALNSPDAYVPARAVDADYMGLKFNDTTTLQDLFVDPDQNVYIVDSGNASVYVLDRYYKHQFTISNFINGYSVADSFTDPRGVFADEETIYVCDTGANRLVLFDRKASLEAGEPVFDRIITRPTSKLFGEDAIYRPVACVVDDYGRIYVVSDSTYQGIIVMTQDGQFTGFIGAQTVSVNKFDILWRRFMSEEQLKSRITYVSTEFNNISIDDDGFIFITTSSIAAADQYKSISSSSGTYSPVKMLNTAGKEVMKRNGFYSPVGEVVSSSSAVSKIVDVAIGPEGTWTIIDEKRSKSYTYDSNGNLLFAFGDTGSQLGNLKTVRAVDYQGDKLLLLDSTAKSFTVYNRTEYGDILIAALKNTNERQYDKAIDYWFEILQRNSNFDAAYIGIGQSYYRDGNYEEAMTYYKSAYDTANYSDAYRELRSEWISKYLIIIPIVIIAVVLLWGLFSKYYKKVNKAAQLKVGRKTYKEELLYAMHVIFHPFDGYWDLKHEKRGSVRAAITIDVAIILIFFYNSIGLGYIMNPYGSYSTVFSVAISILVPLFLCVIANWCLTTLFDGEGSFKDIFVCVSYALVPLMFTMIIGTLLSNVVLANEVDMVNLLMNIGWIWTALLLFFGLMVTHDYTIGKNLLMVICTLLGMVIIMFVGVLFSTLVQKMISFVTNIIVEVNYRM
ncbi:MAG: YIP1 family protein [Clostridia bacterium]|nr:YIP1 family protein [Clostridia bacterium]